MTKEKKHWLQTDYDYVTFIIEILQKLCVLVNVSNVKHFNQSINFTIDYLMNSDTIATIFVVVGCCCTQLWFNFFVICCKSIFIVCYFNYLNYFCMELFVLLITRLISLKNLFHCNYNIISICSAQYNSTNHQWFVYV